MSGKEDCYTGKYREQYGQKAALVYGIYEKYGWSFDDEVEKQIIDGISELYVKTCLSRKPNRQKRKRQSLLLHKTYNLLHKVYDTSYPTDLNEDQMEGFRTGFLAPTFSAFPAAPGWTFAVIGLRMVFWQTV